MRRVRGDPQGLGSIPLQMKPAPPNQLHPGEIRVIQGGTTTGCCSSSEEANASISCLSRTFFLKALQQQH